MRWQSWGIVLSVAVHGAAALGVARIPRDVGRKSYRIAVVDKKKKDEDKPAKADEPPPPPPKPITPPRPKPAPRAPENTPPPAPASTPPPSAAAAAHPQLAALPNLGISMAGGPGAGGIAIPSGPSGPDPGAAARAAEPPKAAAPKPREDCTEDVVKPKSIPISQAGIIAAAQAAGGVEGKIRLELQIDESGNVTSVRVMTGLGGAVDEAAVAAAKRAKVSPITRCGKPVAGRLVYAMTVRSPD